ncbi:cytochrome P450 [Mycobacterium simiae]|uniref:Cytochrome P450 n=1 Tax=Mycobacterium simiae TaxID=1784 RepID=A0A5B1BN93_MYCSI|nr:cytochrome P450 [Mycobacterium simiae]KAA1249552.1 cytochrome P450 [Mycobacterium simiae]
MSPSVFEANLPRLDYTDAQSPEEAHRRIRQARMQSPISMGVHGPEILSYNLIRGMLFDSRFCVAKGLFSAAQGVTSPRLSERLRNTLMTLDGAEHQRIRRLAAEAFSPRSIGRLENSISDVIKAIVEPLIAAGTCDVVQDIAKGYPSPVLCAFLGAAAQDWRLFAEWAEDIFSMWKGAANQDVILRAYDQLDAYIADMVAQRRDHPTDDLISELIRAQKGDRLTHQELCMLVSALLIAGTDSTRDQLAAAVQVLVDHPGQWQLLAENPELATRALNELMRHTPAAIFVIRHAVEDVELAGLMIPAGTQVVINLAAANRDPDIYDDPDRLDITRLNPAPMLTFGAGPHTCLGVHLARAELTRALMVITQRMRNPRRSGPAPWRFFAPLAGPLTLPIEFDAC